MYIHQRKEWPSFIRLYTETVRSSLAKRLGIDIGAVAQMDHNKDIVEVILDATRNYDKPLTKDRLFGWHAAFTPTVGKNPL